MPDAPASAGPQMPDAPASAGPQMPDVLAELRAFLAPFEASTCTPLLPLGRHAHRPPCAQARLSQLLAKHEACVLARRTRRAAKPVKFLPRSVS